MNRAQRTWWRRVLARAPRRLTITRAGQALIAVALVSGMAALNTGNNVLFLAWGMVLSAMVVSGLLSEATLRPLHMTLTLPEELRANTLGHVRVQVRNTSRFLPALAIEMVLTWTDDGGASWPTYAPYQLRLNANAQRDVFVPIRPTRRGLVHLTDVTVRTAYPFGLFIKDRPMPVPPWSLWVLPAPGPAQPGAQAWQGRLGQTAANRAGDGEDYFAMRLYRPGDALKHVLWRRVAKAGRWLVVEREARLARQLVFVVAMDPLATADAHEKALMSVGTLFEQLLRQGMDVGLLGPGVHVQPASDPPGSGRQRQRLLLALAQLAWRPTDPVLTHRMKAHHAHVALVGAGFAPVATVRHRLALVMPS